MTIIEVTADRTTVTIDITGFEDVLDRATKYQQAYLEARGSADAPVDRMAYLQQLVTRQLEGLVQANGYIPSDQEVAFAQKQGLMARNTAVDKLK